MFWLQPTNDVDGDDFQNWISKDKTAEIELLTQRYVTALCVCFLALQQSSEDILSMIRCTW